MTKIKSMKKIVGLTALFAVILAMAAISIKPTIKARASEDDYGFDEHCEIIICGDFEAVIIQWPAPIGNEWKPRATINYDMGRFGDGQVELLDKEYTILNNEPLRVLIDLKEYWYTNIMGVGTEPTIEAGYYNYDGNYYRCGNDVTKAFRGDESEAVTIELPPDPEIEHYIFEGWYFDEGLTLPYNGCKIYEGINLYAKITPMTYFITIVTGARGISYPKHSVTALTAASELPTLTRTGYNFLGWYLDEDCTQTYEPISSMTGDVTVYASWERIIVTVTFYVNGEVYTTVDVPYGATLAEALSEAQSDDEIISAMYSDNNLHSALSVNTVITDSMNVFAELSAGVDNSPGFFARAGNWFAASWIWLVVCVALAAAGVLSGYIVKAKRG